LQPLDAHSVREWRHRRMLSQQELADRAGTSLFTIQRIERGEGNVRPKTGRAVATALGVSIEELLPKAQAPLWSEEVPERRTFDFVAARENLEEYCARWEERIAAGGLDDRAINEFMSTGQSWIPVLDVALRAELNELRQATGLEGSELLQRSEIAQANERYLAVFSDIVRILDRIVQAAGVPADELKDARERRERLAGMPMRAVG
jgi:transcriptional regulator with XRE-family HTH domain